MMQSHCSQFKVQTLLPQLANREIQAILTELKVVKLVERNGRSFAQGCIEREIRYTDPEGCIRKIDDQIQFEVKLGPVDPQAVILTLTRLEQNYFVLQPRLPGNGQAATLEQEFTLTFQTGPAAPLPGEVGNWRLNQLIKQGCFNRLCNFAVVLPEYGARPYECTAQYLMDARRQGALLCGVLRGTISYLGRCTQFLPFKQPAGFLTTGLPKENEGEVVLVPQVKDVTWHPGDLTRNEWLFEAILEFKWYLIRPTELACRDGSTVAGPSVVKLKAVQPLGQWQLRFDRTITFRTAEVSITELQVILTGQKEEWTSKGLLLTANLRVEMFYVLPGGAEAYRQWTADCYELAPEVSVSEVGPTVHLRAKAAVEVLKYFFRGGELRIELILTYDLRLWREQVAQVVQAPGSAYRILAETRTDPQVFTTFEQAEFVLRSLPAQIHGVKTVLSQLICIPQTGKVDVQGQQEVQVSYCDYSHQQHTDFFQHRWRTGFIWGEIDPTMQLVAEARLIFDRYTPKERKLDYQFWWELRLTATRLQEVPVALAPGASLVWSDRGVTGENEARQISRFSIEREFRLQWGLPREIAANRSRIAQFNWRQAGQALLVFGQIDSVLEYWDRHGVLCRDCQALPFWHFAPWPAAQVATGLKRLLQPRIVRCVYQPLGWWPKVKQRIKLLVELELQLKEGDDGSDEDFDAKSDCFTDDSGRGYGSSCQNR